MPPGSYCGDSAPREVPCWLLEIGIEKAEPAEATGSNSSVAEHGDSRAWVIELRHVLRAVVGVLTLY